MSRKKAIDSIDKKILDIMQNDGRITNREIASIIGLSEGATLVRVNKLIERNIISQRSVVNLKWFNLTYQTIVDVVVPEDHVDDFIEKAFKLDGLIRLSILKREVNMPGPALTPLKLKCAHESQASFEKEFETLFKSLDYYFFYQVYLIEEVKKKLPTIEVLKAEFDK